MIVHLGVRSPTVVAPWKETQVALDRGDEEVDFVDQPCRKETAIDAAPNLKQQALDGELIGKDFKRKRQIDLCASCEDVRDAVAAKLGHVII